METLKNQEKGKKTYVGLTFEDFGDNDLMRKKMKQIMKPEQTGTSAKERLLILKYLISPQIKQNFFKHIHYIGLLDKLCDLDKSTIQSAAKELNDHNYGYTPNVYLKKLQEIKEVFECIIPASYNPNDPQDRVNYKYITDTISKISDDIEKVKEEINKKRC